MGLNIQQVLVESSSAVMIITLGFGVTIGALSLIITKLIIGDNPVSEFTAIHLNPIFIEQSPSIALGQAKEEVLRMGQLAIKGMEEANHFLKTKHEKHTVSAYQLEKAIHHFDRKITDYLIDLSSSSLSAHEFAEHSALMDTVRNIERIGSHFENIIERIGCLQASKVKMTDSAIENLNVMFQLAISTVQDAMHALDQNDRDTARAVIKKEKEIDQMERLLRKQHNFHLTNGICTGQAGIVYVDIINNLERISGHAANIAKAVISDWENGKI